MQFLIYGLAFLGGAGITVLFIIWVSILLDTFTENRRARITCDVSHKFHHHLRMAAGHFATDPPTMQLLLGFADGKSVEDLQKAWLKDREEKTPPAEVKAGPWVFCKPHFVDSEDCMGHPRQYWRVWARRDGGTVRDVCGVGRTAEEAMAVCRKKTRTKAEVLYARSRPGSGCCDTYCDNMSCDCLEEALDA